MEYYTTTLDGKYLVRYGSIPNASAIQVVKNQIGTAELVHLDTIPVIPASPNQALQWNLITGEWDDPRTFAQIQNAQWGLVKTKREQLKYSPFTWDGSVFDGDQEAIDNIRTAINAGEMMPAGSTQAWRLHDNSIRTLTLDQLKQAELTRAIRVGQIFAIASNLRDQIYSSNTQTKEDVLAITWPE